MIQLLDAPADISGQGDKDMNFEKQEFFYFVILCNTCIAIDI